jgi:phage tail sheath protein FI
MSTAAATIPGLYFTVGARPAGPSPLRSDVAGFMGRTRRGIPGRLVRVEGWRAYVREFGGLDRDALTPYAIRGYFENGGEVAHVVRLAGKDIKTATATWKVAELDINGQLTPESPTAFRWTEYRIEASTPGKWARDTQVNLRYRLEGSAGKPEVDLVVQVPEQVPFEPIEYLVGLSLDEDAPELHDQVAARSQFLRLVPVGQPLPPPMGPPPPAPKRGPRQIVWPTLSLALDPLDDQFEPPDKFQYMEAIVNTGNSANWSMADQPEVAIVALPDLHSDVRNTDDRWELIETLIRQAEPLRDRLILLDLPPPQQNGNSSRDAEQVVRWTSRLREITEGDERLQAVAAVYHPRVTVPDPLGGILNPLRCIPPSGHVAGVISRLDRERGAHHTPANAQVFEAVDVGQRFEELAQSLLFAEGVNLLQCSPGRGIQVWGGRTVSRADSARFIAHRRLIHRLVRAIRRVVEPLVFHTNGPELWLTFVRAITTVLLEAYHAGALKGSRPEEAFRVQCDEKTTTPEDIENGRMICQIEVAPATPMEFIRLRIAVSSDATLEVFET